MSSHKSRQRFILYGKTFIVPAVIVLSIAGIINSSYNRSRSRITHLHSRLARLESMAARAQAIRDIKRLQYAYGHYMEFGLWEDIADLFSEKGKGHYPAGDFEKGQIGRYFPTGAGRGKQGLPWGTLNSHIMLQPVVNLGPGENSARGRWRLFSMQGNYRKKAYWEGGVYENEYILENGVWKIKDLHLYPQYGGPYEQEGWSILGGSIPAHYTPDTAGNPVPKDETAAPEDFRTEKNLRGRLNELLNRAERLNDENEVKNLQNIYGYYVDRKMWDDVADLFSTDGTMEVNAGGVYAGRKSIRRGLERFGPQGLREGEINDHLQLQIIINISPDGQNARARGIELIMSGKYEQSGEWGLGIFENEYVKKDGVWQFRSMRIYPRMLADYSRGWARGVKPVPEIGEKYAPDRFSNITWEPYPKFYIPRFHYNNPVTALPPRYPEGAFLSEAADDAKTAMPSGTGLTVNDLSIKEMEKMANEIEMLIRRAIAYDASENLTSAYGYYIDQFNWDGTADLFAEDGWRELPFVGVYSGRDRIRKSLNIRYSGTGGKPSGFFTCHQLVQPVIHVSKDGQSTKIRVRLFQLAGGDGSNGLWMAGIYEKKAAVKDGLWKLTAMDLDYTWTADYKGGWQKGGMSFQLSAGDMAKKIPPDRPLRGPSNAPYPGIEDIPFHYVNPVSGRKPPLLLNLE